MVVEVNIESCLNYKISPGQYVLLNLLWQKKTNTAVELLKVDPSLKDSVKDLTDRGYILKTGASFIIERKKCNDLFGLSEDQDFWEFFNTFPLKVSSKGSTRPLRAQDPGSKNALEARSKYKARVKTKAAHRHVMACLEAEMDQKRRSNNLGYMQNILTWLNQSTWQLSEYLLKNEQPKVVEKHGEGLV